MKVVLFVIYTGFFEWNGYKDMEVVTVKLPTMESCRGYAQNIGDMAIKSSCFEVIGEKTKQLKEKS